METINDIERELREYGDRPPPRRAWIDLADRLHAAYKRDMQAIVEANETAIRTAMGEVAKLMVALKEAIPFSCLKCTLWNSRAARCSRGSGMCDQVWKWKTILGEVEK